MKRRRMSRKASKKTFRRGAKVAGKNLKREPMRGGWRV